MRYNSVFEIIGPVMVGPSSSHTAGAARIGNLARALLAEEPIVARFYLMGSFAETYQGHGTDLALIGGVMGFGPGHPGLATADLEAQQRGLEYSFQKKNFGFFHPNTVTIQLYGETKEVNLIASSIGGGKAEVQEVDGLPVKFTGERPTLVLYHTDTRGFLAKVFHIIDGFGYNIARLSMERWNPNGNAITVCEIDGYVRPELGETLKAWIPELQDYRLIRIE